MVCWQLGNTKKQPFLALNNVLITTRHRLYAIAGRLITMDTKIAALSGILVMILVGGGLLVVIDNPTDESNNDTDKAEPTQPVVVVNQPPVVMFSEQSKVWDGEHISINGFATDEIVNELIIIKRLALVNEISI